MKKEEPAVVKGLEVVTHPKPVTISTKGRGLELASLDDMYRFAQYVISSGLAPKGIDKPESVVIVLQMGFELGLSPMQSLQNIAPINGRPCVWGDAVPGLVEASGKQEYGYPTQIGERNPNGSYSDSYGYKYTTKRVGRKEYSYSFTVADAKKASLWGKTGPWTFYPDRMLLNRARTFCDRDVYPDVLKGLITVDEATHIVDAEFTVEDNKTSTEKLEDIVCTGTPAKEITTDPAPPETVDTETGEIAEPPETTTKDKKDGPGGFSKEELAEDISDKSDPTLGV